MNALPNGVMYSSRAGKYAQSARYKLLPVSAIPGRSSPAAWSSGLLTAAAATGKSGGAAAVTDQCKHFFEIFLKPFGAFLFARIYDV